MAKDQWRRMIILKTGNFFIFSCQWKLGFKSLELARVACLIHGQLAFLEMRSKAWQLPESTDGF
jgi:hypothetical protein